MGQERRHFTDEFKTEAVALLASSGRPLVQIAGELGLSPSMLRNWRNRQGGGNTGAGVTQGSRIRDQKLSVMQGPATSELHRR